MARKNKSTSGNKSFKNELKTPLHRENKSMLYIPLLIIVVIAALIPFCYGKYIEFNTNDPFDGGLNVYSSECLSRGQKLGVDVFPSARPGTILVNLAGVSLFGYSEFGPKVIQTVMQFTAFMLIFYTIWKIYGAIPACVSVLLAAFYLSCPPFAKFGNVKEQYFIAYAIIAACGIMLHHTGGKWWWLLVSGVSMFNAYYFKETGISVTVAIILYHFFRPVFKKCSWSRYGREVVLLCAGTTIGWIPYILFYLWQGRLFKHVAAFPASFAFMTTICFVVYGFILLGYKLALKQYGQIFEQRVRRLPLKNIVIVLCCVIVGLILFIFFFSGPDGPVNRLRSVPVLGYPVELLARVIVPIKNMVLVALGHGNGYVASGRLASGWATQTSKIFTRYHNSFIVPIGLGLIGIFWGIVDFVRSKLPSAKKHDDIPEGTTAPMKSADGFVLLLALWWILDMLFVWISPKAYVQYFLPLNASGAMLAGYVVHKCLKKDWGLTVLLGSWLFIEVITAFVIKDKLIAAELWGMAYFKNIVPHIIIIALALAVLFAGNKFRFRKIAVIILGILCVVSFYYYNEQNLNVFKGRVAEINKQKKSPVRSSWELLSHYIRDNSSEDDGLYVWGWMPGIYLQSQRFSTAKTLVAYSDMHTDSPEKVSNKVSKLVEELKADPPRYIVDSQKIHFPDCEHPTFDLWPCWRDRANKQLHLRIFPSQGYNYKQMFKLNELEKFTPLIMVMTENWTKAVLVNPNHDGGPLSEEKAAERGKIERERHEAMMPLRQFVMQNYKPCPKQIPGFVLFERK